ncbi:PD-(D/E)XK nuclease family protein [Mucilaginibacter sp. PAMB04168]|uniref:PD-(D/E)XK nuclease family protein n=1 Tax=Mucilaginibacter sp. PAMB04168 TaxID=3138567 RepID=UPI0031F671D4
MIRTPLEDFTTEILAGILSADIALGDAFVNTVLKIPGNGFTFSTQECYDLLDDKFPDCRVDLVVRGQGLICFVEHKVESREGYVQLERYSRVLSHLAEADADLNTYLRYCTKYYDLKSATAHSFQQFRWADVYRFLVSHQTDSDLIRDYLGFLKKHDMSDEMNFTITDLMTLQGLPTVAKKMDRYLAKLRPLFHQFFPLAKIKDSNNLHQLTNNSRFVFHADSIFGEGYAELGVGFDFDETVQLKVWIWVNDKNSSLKLFQQALRSTEFANNGKNWLGIYKPLSDFVSAELMEEQIEAWFAASFAAVKRFSDEHPELVWNLL